MIQTDGSERPEEDLAENPADRRRSRRVPVSLPGRYLLENGGEYACTCIDVSVGGVRLRASQAGPWGSRVIAYIDSIGRLEGYIVRRAPGWFALETPVGERKGERVQERIEWILESDARHGAAAHEVVHELARHDVSLATQDGRQHAAQLTDISRGGAALLTQAPLEVGEMLRLESRRARVARVFPGGAALSFDNGSDDAWAPRQDEFEPPRARRA